LKKNKLAIFAAAGNLTILAIEKALKMKKEFIIVGFKNISEFQRLEKYKNINLYKIQIGYLKGILKILKKEDVTSILLVGKIEKVNLLKAIKFDLTTLRLFLKLKDYSDSSLLQGIVDFFGEKGIGCLSQKEYFSELITPKGFLTQKRFGKKDLENLKWGYEKAQAIASLNIGQSIIIGNKVVVSVEGIEGTDKMISRSFNLVLKDNSFIKVAGKGHNPKYDLPAFGLSTVRLLYKAHIRKIVLEAGMVMIPQMEEVIQFANKQKMMIYGL